ncbi:unnamed protein product [Dracunculus medinensis]|uniref:Ras-like GTP-binding protein Rho1 n=1 Tax=Dracunculus medinensis TaxID=318479 RepID=A0A0N4UFY0_DRAME|nr:unnamed protein product [Dracunculus medinensis]
MTKKPLKFVVVGDGGCGKTSLIMVQAGGEFTDNYIPTAFDDYAIEALINGKTKVITVCDTAGEDDYNSLRPLSYPDADVFIVCYSVERPGSIKSIREKWLPEIKKFCPEVPILIIGNKKDIRCERKALTTSSHDKIKDSNFNGLVDIDEASALACEFTPHKVIECSAKTKEGVRQVFDTAIRVASSHRSKKNNRVLSSIMKLKLVF